MKALLTFALKAFLKVLLLLCQHICFMKALTMQIKKTYLLQAITECFQKLNLRR